MEILIGIGVYLLGIIMIPFVAGIIKPDNRLNFDIDDIGIVLLLFWPLIVPVGLFIFVVGGIVMIPVMLISKMSEKVLLYGEYLGQKRIDRKERQRQIKEDLARREYYEKVN